MTCIAYLRVSTLEQDVKVQKDEITRFAKYKQIKVDEFIPIVMSSRKEQSLRRIDELKAKLKPGDTLISSELSRLGRSLVEVVSLINQLVALKVRIILIRQNIDTGTQEKLSPDQKLLIGIFSSLAEMERDLISVRTKEGLLLAKNNKGHIGGRRAGTLFKSKYDKHLPKIKEYLIAGHGLKTIIRLLKEGHHVSLSEYLAKRNIRSKKA